MEFPVLFLGGKPNNTPALYSLMNYADIKLGTWYPKGGMFAVVQGIYELAKQLNVRFLFDFDVEGTRGHVLTICQEIAADNSWNSKIGQTPPNDPTRKGQ